MNMFLHLEKISKPCRFFFWLDKMKEQGDGKKADEGGKAGGRNRVSFRNRFHRVPDGVEFIALNTDAQQLQLSEAPVRVHGESPAAAQGSGLSEEGYQAWLPQLRAAANQPKREPRQPSSSRSMRVSDSGSITKRSALSGARSSAMASTAR